MKKSPINDLKIFLALMLLSAFVGFGLSQMLLERGRASVPAPVELTNSGLSGGLILTVHVDDFVIIDNQPYLDGKYVDIDSELDGAELFYVKEEINVRLVDNEYHIVEGDNGQF